MKSVSAAEAINLLIHHAPKPVAQTAKLERAHNRVLLQAIHAPRDNPPTDVSAMDGYAVCGPLHTGEDRRVIGESRAGKAFDGKMTGGQAVRIFTGAPMPEGATRVILQEWIESNGAHIALKPGATVCTKPHVRERGTDYLAGDILLQPGETMDAWRLAVAAAAGAANLSVARRPKVAVLCCGDELIPPGQPLRNDQTYESNSYALTALIRDWGAIPQTVATVTDDIEELCRVIGHLHTDILVTIGGASVGDYDFIRRTLDHMGMQWIFGTIDIKPGKPTAFGRLSDGRLVLCLPGNPATALVCAQLFLRPLIETALGAPTPPRFECLPSAIALPATGPRETYLLATILAGADDTPVLLAFSDQDSSRILPLAQTSALIRRPGNSPPLMAGEACRFIRLARS